MKKRYLLLCSFLSALCASTWGHESIENLPLGHRDFTPTPQHPVGWRGDSTGRFPGAKPASAWNIEQGINILWRVPLVNFSNAQPIVVGNRIYVLAESRQLICLIKMTGQILWVNNGGDGPTTNPAEMNAVVEARLLPGGNDPANTEWSIVLDGALVMGTIRGH